MSWVKAWRGLESQDCVWSWQTLCTLWMQSLELTEPNQQQQLVCWTLYPGEIHGAELVQYSKGFPAGTGASELFHFFASYNFNPAQPVLPLEPCQDCAHLAPPSGNISSLLRGCCRCRASASGFCCGTPAPSRAPAHRLEVRLVLEQVLRLLRSSHTRCSSCGNCGALCLEPVVSSLNCFILKLDSAVRSPWQRQLHPSRPLCSLSFPPHPAQPFPLPRAELSLGLCNLVALAPCSGAASDPLVQGSFQLLPDVKWQI